jgi:tRNA modification GTPase
MCSLVTKKGIVVINKADLPQTLPPSGIAETLAGWPQVSVSALKNQGLDTLKEELQRCFVGSIAEPELIVTNLRHKAALEQAKDSLDEVTAALANGLPPEMVAVDLQEARNSLEAIIGTVTNDEILDRIFSQFCIGK